VFVTDMEGASEAQTGVGISRGKAVKGSGAVHVQCHIVECLLNIIVER